MTPLFFFAEVGSCPASNNYWNLFCSNTCSYDGQCPNTQKCCYDGSCYRCMYAIQYNQYGQYGNRNQFSSSQMQQYLNMLRQYQNQIPRNPNQIPPNPNQIPPNPNQIPPNPNQISSNQNQQSATQSGATGNSMNTYIGQREYRLGGLISSYL